MMVTGLELAGIILAALPLLVSAVEHRDVGLEPLNAMLFRKKRKATLQQTINENNMLFRHCCESMLSMAEIENIADLVAKDDNDKMRKSWADPSLELRLKSRFGLQDFNVIQSRLEEIARIIGKLQNYLEAGHVRQVFKSVSQVKDIELLGIAILALKNVLEGESLSVVIGTAGTAWQDEIEEMKVTRTHLLNIYDCVETSWGCACKKDHIINFQCRDGKDAHLTIVLAASSSRPGAKRANVPWLLQPLQISTCKQNQSTASTITATNLCKSLENCTRITELSSPPTSQKYRYSIQTSEPLPQPKALVPLPSLLKNTPDPTQSSRMGCGHKNLLRTPRDRIVVGARLLVTVLQQHSTPWLLPNWSINDVFLRLGDGCSLQPYFEAPFNTPTVTVSNSDPFNLFFSRNATLYSLGVALIEIAMNDTMDNLITDGDRAVVSREPTMARAVAAYRLCKELANHLIPLEYRNATRYCLKGEFETDIEGKELSDGDLFSTIYRKAAKPLMELVSRNYF